MNKVILDEERLRFLYLEKGLSMKEIADQLSISIGTVFNRCKQYSYFWGSGIQSVALYEPPVIFLY